MEDRHLQCDCWACTSYDKLLHHPDYVRIFMQNVFLCLLFHSRVWNNVCLAKLLHRTIPGIYSGLVLVFRLAKVSLEWQQFVILFNVDELSVKTDR